MQFSSLSAVAHVLALLPLGEAADECQPATWVAKRDLANFPSPTAGERPYVTPLVTRDIGEALPGEVVCRSWGETDEEVNYYTCTELADFHWIDIETFFKLNPEINDDCSNIQPNTEYCTDGWIEPLRNKDGRCGPHFGHASCAYSDFPCCNSETWTCGITLEDCADGTCYEGLCPGHTVYTTDGKCGLAHGMQQCAGKWGDCCNMNGECGTGPDFCGLGKCQLGNCTTSALPPQGTSIPVFTFTPGTPNAPTTTAATATGTTSTAGISTSSAASPACTGGTRAEGVSDNLIGLCSYSCDFNHCPAGVCVCTGPASEPAAIPELTDRHGCPDDNVAGGPDNAYYVDLCEFTCSHGYCPPGACKYC
ncbi:hypothetical protein GCG54_00004079 [Colletotrichum gloeosporioides]|uniref:Chitin-binding type-1 domain-containing protein n=1 Tax=Colletotrichum gloeosporioides TaxID=474922 RepID=A0A8H4CIX0_COLGL|nr:uncharacterized protein GCG54_00004079 [Colletotrichum gloeosporioides]KAF3804810.1 hypothetical protein GCG54_00004079 [Colletotrichum gloeosporioides]